MRSNRVLAALLALLLLISAAPAALMEAVEPEWDEAWQVEPEVGLADDAGDTGLTVEYEDAVENEDAGEDEIVYGSEPLDDAVLSDDGVAALDGDATDEGALEIEALAIEAAGYVAVAPEAPVYADAARTQAIGVFPEGAAVYAEPTGDSGMMLRIWFDTEAARGWNEAILTGYVQSADCLAYTEAEAEAFRQQLAADARTRCQDGVAIPCVAFTAVNFAVSAGESSVGLGVTAHTQAEIQAFVNSHPAYPNQINIYSTAANDNPYAYGKLSPVNQQSALNLVNQFRYIAGLGSDLTLLTGQEEAMGATSLVLRLYSEQYKSQYGSDILTHYPGRAAAIADASYDSLYAAGYAGAGRSNIAMGYTVTNSLLAYMADSDDNNIKTVGHRRWILNPKMGATAFGANGRFSAMYAHDQSAAGGQTKVAWPAQEMPVEYFSANDPWSISYGRTLNADKVTVTLVRVRDSKTWSFSTAKADGVFYVENSGYGQRGCVIFRPSDLGEFAVNETFNVSVNDAEAGELTRYTVHFFSLDMTACQALDTITTVSAVKTPTGSELSWNGVSGAQSYYICRRASTEAYYRIVADVSGTSYKDTAVSADADYYYQIYGHTANRTSRAAIAVMAKPVPPDSVALNHTGTITIYRNQTLQLSASFAPANAMARLTWKSSKKKYATVDANGLVTPVKKGTTIISVTTDNGKQASVKVKVINPPKATKVLLNHSGTVMLNVGDTLQLSGTVLPAQADQRITWKTGSKKIATVSDTGLVKALKAGKVTITAKSASGKKARVTFRVVDPYAPDAVALSASGTVTLHVGETLKLDATLAPATARTVFSWSSSRKRVASVDDTGVVRALRRGKATITVKTANGKKARVKIKVVK